MPDTGTIRTRKSKSGPVPSTKTNGDAINGTKEADLHALLSALQSVAAGDFSVRLPGHQTGLIGKIADSFNEIVGANARMAEQLEHVGQVVGREGRTRHRVK